MAAENNWSSRRREVCHGTAIVPYIEADNMSLITQQRNFRKYQRVNLSLK